MKYIKKRRELQTWKQEFQEQQIIRIDWFHRFHDSASPAMQNYGFQACGVDGAYLAFDIKEEEVPEFVKSMRLLNIQGCNVTMPNKTSSSSEYG